MTATNVKNLDWSQRLAIINNTKATNAQASKVFNVTEAEIVTARENVTPAANFDTTPYAAHFSVAKPSKSTATADSNTPTAGTVVKKKRGRTGSKVKNAFLAITETPQPLAEFAQQHGVSVNVLKQKKRFTTDENDNILPEFAGRNFKVVQHNGVDSIWYEKQNNISSI